MRSTFPVRTFPWIVYLPPALICLAAIIVSLWAYPGLPEKLASHFNSRGEPMSNKQPRRMLTAAPVGPR